MKGFIARITGTALLLLAAFRAFAAGEVTFEASSPLTVAVGEAFRVEFALNADPDEGSFQAPSFEGFDVIAGPAESRGHSVQIVGNSMTKSINYTITYVLLPQSAGNVTIGPARIDVEGKTYRTEPLPIEIVNEGDASRAQQRPQRGGPGGPDGGGQRDVQQQIGKDDILLRAVVSKSSVYKNEPLHVAFKLYTRVPYVNIVPESAPSFNGFWSQDLSAPGSARIGRESYNGKVYETRVLFDYLLYPQQVGTLSIDPVEMTVVAQVMVQSRHVDPFFGGGHEVFNVPRKVKSQRAAIEVRPLPEGAPSSFSGAVGSFRMDTDLPSDRFAANSGATCMVKISGTGNLTFVQAPKLALPASFEQYNVKTTESINTSASGISGYRQFEYPFIARAEGTYEVDPIEFTYFDLERRQYVTLQSKPMTLEVTPDVRGGGGDAVVMQGRGMSKEEVKMLGQDIRFIKLGAPQLRATGAQIGRSGLLGRAVRRAGAVRRGLCRAAPADPRVAERRAGPRQAGQQGRRAAFPRRPPLHGGTEPPRLLRGDAPRVVGLHERQVQHSGGQPHEGERPRGAAQAGRVGRGVAALHGHHHAVRRGAVFARGVGADERRLFGGRGPDLPHRGGHKTIVS